MATADVEKVAEPAPAVPDYLASPNAVFEDQGVEWRYGHPPDYSKTRADWEKTKTMNHEAGSLPQLVENLVKNWEVEASFKPRLQDWRTIDHANYSFSINGGPPQTAEHMLKVGTYNAIVAPNEYYSPEYSDFAASHKTFKRMMPTFAWEVLEVYSGPPKVAFKWRHWGEMKHDYVGFNNKGEKVTVKAHGGKIDIQGITVAEVDDKVRLQKVDTYFDPMTMFHQIAPNGIVNKQIVKEKVVQPDVPEVPANDGVKIAEQHNGPAAIHDDLAPQDVVPKELSPSTGLAADAYVPHRGTSTAAAKSDPSEKTDTIADNVTEPAAIDDGALSESSKESWEQVEHATAPKPEAIEGNAPSTMEAAVKPNAGEAVVAAADAQETRMTHEEMSTITPMECPFLMNCE